MCSAHYQKATRGEYIQQYYQNHKEEYAERSRQWRAAHPERWVSYGLNWQKANPQKAANLSARRRAKMAENGVFSVTQKDIDRLIARFSGKCAYCKVRLAEHLDHVFPIARGGVHSIGNLLPACQPCNQSKHASTLVEWRYRLQGAV